MNWLLEVVWVFTSNNFGTLLVAKLRCELNIELPDFDIAVKLPISSETILNWYIGDFSTPEVINLNILSIPPLEELLTNLSFISAVANTVLNDSAPKDWLIDLSTLSLVSVQDIIDSPFEREQISKLLFIWFLLDSKSFALE